MHLFDSDDEFVLGLGHHGRAFEARLGTVFTIVPHAAGPDVSPIPPLETPPVVHVDPPIIPFPDLLCEGGPPLTVIPEAPLLMTWEQPDPIACRFGPPPPDGWLLG